MADPQERLECPMCDFTVYLTDTYVLQLHFEQEHTTDSPFRIQEEEALQPPQQSATPSTKPGRVPDTPSSDDEDDTVLCPELDCGELIPLPDFNDHLDYHVAETLSFDETSGEYHSHSSSAIMQPPAGDQSHTSTPKKSSSHHSFDADSPRKDHHRRRSGRHSNRHRSNTNSSEKSTLSRSISTFNPFTKPSKTAKPPNKSARLGKNELGPYAWEENMPSWLYDQLARGPKITIVNRIGRDGRLLKQEQVQNETPGLIPILAQLSDLDRSVKEAYYCHPSTVHIGKTPKEGGFCGYRNIQMLISYIQGSKAQGHEEFHGRTPGILKLQDLIEEAWDKNINEVGRIQTGGIRNTRKYIGTPEAQALFLSSEIDCAVEMFSDSSARGTEAHEELLAAVERYFSQATVDDGTPVSKTLLPPIYLQQPGHSVTIVGFERRRDGTSNLVVFDPMYTTSPAMHKLVGRKDIRNSRPEVMHAYRRGVKQLHKHAAFEILMLTATPPLFPAWDVRRQFPDCRYVYAFFRSRTLGYDIYPEDYFLSNFPWQQYGGLWICDEARFARAEPFNSRTAQELRRITGQTSSTGSSESSSSASPFIKTTFSHAPASDSSTWEEPGTHLPALTHSSDKLTSGFVNAAPTGGSGPVYNMGQLPQPDTFRPRLSLLTDVGRKYPGFPTPLSPTLSAKEMFPSPACDDEGGPVSSRAASYASGVLSAISATDTCVHDATDDLSPVTHIYQSPRMNFIDSVITDCSNSIDHIRIQSTSYAREPAAHSPTISNVTSPVSLTSPSSIISPRSAMMKTMLSKAAFQDNSHNPTLYPPYAHPSSLQPSTPYIALPYSPSSPAPSTLTSPLFPATRSIAIANGTETSLTSPISPTGTMLLYTSNRGVDSGLLGVRPLTEAQVAEYRFWRPCGRRVCAFGCGGAHQGEWAAAKRLFRDVPDVERISMWEGCRGVGGLGDGSGSGGSGGALPRSSAYPFGFDGQCDESGSEDSVGGRSASVWAGRRLVTNWNEFLKGCEREGVARL